MTDHLVVFTPSGKRGRFAAGTPIIEAARELGVYVESVCGGRATCGRCQVEIQTGHFSKHGIESKAENISSVAAKEQRYIDIRGLPEGRRLSCSSTVQGDLVVDIPADAAVNRQVVRKDADSKIFDRNPAIKLCYIEVEEPDMHQPLGDLDRVIIALKDQWHFSAVQIAPHLLPHVQSVLRKGKWQITAAMHQPEVDGPATIIALYPGLKNEAYGIACDIGSTTIALHLVSLLSGITIASSGASNPQIRFGEDLMSRVSYVMMNPEGRGAMTEAVRKTLNELIGDVVKDAEIDRNDILDTVFVGNPIMHHLFLGIDPTELGGAPFALAVSDAVHMPAVANGLDLNAGAQMYMLPCIAGHVGADAAAATLAEGPHRSDDIMLMVDVGTNAEIVLGNKHHTVAASSPTGPAFEGAEISSGQRAAPGAIERVRIDPETLEPRFKVIGADMWSDEDGFDEAVKDIGITGICGSGIIEVVAEMLLARICSEDGVIDGTLAARSPRIIENSRTFSYVLHKGVQNITVTQNDIRAIQLAKAALYAGIKLLMDRQNITQIDQIRFAGAFGSFIDPKYAMVLGLIPDCDLENVKAVGNAAGTGARMALINRDFRREIETTVRKIEKVETALESKFQDHFVAAMAMPNKIDAFPKLGAVIALPPRMARPANDADGNPGRPQRRGGRRR